MRRRVLAPALLALLLLASGNAIANTCTYTVAAHLMRDVSWDNEYGRLDESIGTIQKLGFDCVRLDFFWNTMEPRPGVFNFDRQHEVVQALRRKGIGTIAVVHKPPKWVSDTMLPVAWDGFVNTILERFPNVDVWEVWNEPNVTAFWRREWPTELFSRFLLPFETASRRGVPVISGGLDVNRERIAFERVLGQSPARRWLAGYGTHPYRLRGAKLRRFLLRVQSKLETRWGRVPQLWLTEYGWSTPDPSRHKPPRPAKRATPEEQAERLFETLLLARAMRLANFTLFELRDDRSQSGYGLYDIRFRPKPAAHAAAFFLKRLRHLDIQIAAATDDWMHFSIVGSESSVRAITTGTNATLRRPGIPARATPMQFSDTGRLIPVNDDSARAVIWMAR